MKNILSFLLLFFWINAIAQKPNIVPEPKEVWMKTGNFVLDSQTQWIAKGFVWKDLPVVLESVEKITGFRPQIPNKGSQKVIFELVNNPSLEKEGYLMDVNTDGVLVQANTKVGLFYATQTLMQCLPPTRTNQKIEIPCMKITDTPRFGWRGSMLDVCRHFFPISFVKQYIDMLASYKMNTFHWHLTDDQGWRIEIKKYPKLTQVGAFRAGTTVGRNEGNDNLPHGGFYTQEEIKEVVAYAAARNVTVVPEIEIPGHASAAIAAYPELSCFPNEATNKFQGFASPNNGKQVQQYWGVFEDVFCPSEFTFGFLDDVLTEVVALFPSQYIHIGGDECPKESWKRSDLCQKIIKDNQLKDEHELQSYFIKRIEKMLNQKGKKIIGWDEILEGGLAPNAAVMSWRGENGGIEAAKQGHFVVMTPETPLYFNFYQGDPETEPLAIGGFNTLKKVYQYEPIPSVLTESESKFVMGAQANIWTEYIDRPEGIEYMLLPRLLAISEVLWSPKDKKNWDGFTQKLPFHKEKFKYNGWRYSNGNFKVDFKPKAENGKLSLVLDTEQAQYPVYYTTNGARPDRSSIKYEKPIEINQSFTISAAVVLPNTTDQPLPSTQSFSINKATGYAVEYQNKPNRHYPGGGKDALTDGIIGNTDHGQYWHAFIKDDLIATIDLQLPQNIKSIGINCLQKNASWIFLPKWVKFEISSDGKNYTTLEQIENSQWQDSQIYIKKFETKKTANKVRYIRITAKNVETCPDNHPGKGGSAWLFADEIMVE